jgi:hypothetical protein
MKLKMVKQPYKRMPLEQMASSKEALPYRTHETARCPRCLRGFTRHVATQRFVQKSAESERTAPRNTANNIGALLCQIYLARRRMGTHI